jgi:tight adherence protein B
VTIALLAGVGMALISYVALEELELVRHGRWIRRSLVTSEKRGPRRRLPSVGRLWSRLSAGELPLRAIQITSAATVLVFIAGLATRSLGLSMLGALGGIVAGYAWTQRRRWTLAARVDRQLPEAMTVTANGLSAGSTLFQALETAARETPPPLGPLLQRVVAQAQLAVTIEESLRQLRDAVRSDDLGNLVAALAIQRTTGGDLARLLRESVTFLREEQRLRADARALSAQARYSAQMIGVMPVGLFALFYALFPSFVEPLTTTTAGLLILSYCLVSSALGFYFIWRIAMGIEQA